MQMTPNVQAAEDRSMGQSRPAQSKMANRDKGKQALKLITVLPELRELGHRLF